MAHRIATLAAALLTGAMPALAASPGDAAAFDKEIRPLIAQFCGDCHGKSKDVPLMAVGTFAQIQEHRGHLRSSVAQLRNRTMPPADEEQPSEDQRRRMADWLERVLRETAREMGPYAGAVTARRLNRLEYDNTVRDLLGLRMKFSETFPSDGGGGEGFDNNGETLYLPVILMERYLEAAEAILEEAVITPATLRTYAGEALGRVGEEGRHLDVSVTLAGPHRLKFSAKSEGPARLVLHVDGIRAETFTFKEGTATHEAALQFFRGTHRITFKAESGTAELTAAELTDLPKAPNPERAEAHRRLLGDLAPGSLKDAPQARRREAAEASLVRFTRRAWRRPTTAKDVAGPMALFDRSAARGENFETSMKLALKAVFVSPRFLYRLEADHAGPGPRPVDDHELAVRLSYFLWNSMPDDELFALADAGRLGEPDTLTAQMSRLLRDPKADSFIRNFTEQWLGTKAVGETVPVAPESVKESYNKNLGADMRKEAFMLVDHVLRGGRPVTELLSADYTFLNERLAKHYGIEGVRGPDLRRVQLKDASRGGILGLGAVHMLTVPETRTSPVLRGAWILSTLMGTPVPAPPPDVPALEGAGKKKAGSLRQALEQHRADPSCAACHNLIDPMGFALERYDRLGRIREVDERGKKVDSSGVTAAGEKFSGLPDFRRILLKREGDFARQATSKLLGYALGRSLSDRDDGTIEGIVDRIGRDGFRSDLLLREIVLSVPFRQRGPVEDAAAPKAGKSPKKEPR